MLQPHFPQQILNRSTFSMCSDCSTRSQGTGGQFELFSHAKLRQTFIPPSSEGRRGPRIKKIFCRKRIPNRLQKGNDRTKINCDILNRRTPATRLWQSNLHVNHRIFSQQIFWRQHVFSSCFQKLTYWGNSVESS